MTTQDIFIMLRALRPEMDLEMDNVCEPFLYYIEQRIANELLHTTRKFGEGHLLLPDEHCDVYWTCALSYLALRRQDWDDYRENRKLFEAAWENLCRQVFLQKENFKIRPQYPIRPEES